MKDFCKDCAWSKVKEELKFCIDLQSSSATECNRRYILKDDGEQEICETCKRDKDPGVCWWCGN